MTAASLASAASIMHRRVLDTVIVVGILFVIGVGLGILKLWQEQRRMQNYRKDDYCDSCGKYIHQPPRAA